MPTYEMPLLLRAMSRPEVVTSLRRVAQVIFSRGGFIRKIENLGHQPIPYKMRAHGHTFKEASYFLLYFDAPPRSLEDMKEEYRRDLDIIKNKIYKSEKEPSPPCTFHDEQLPAPYRAEVQKMVAIAKRQSKNKYEFKYNSGLNYYPFQR